MLDRKLKNCIRAAAKGSVWKAKGGVLVCRQGDWVLSVNIAMIGWIARPGEFEFRAKPIYWDTLLWSILQILENEKQPITFHYWGTFTCQTPPLAEKFPFFCRTDEAKASALLKFAEKHRVSDRLWKDISFDEMLKISPDRRRRPYINQTTAIVALIASGDVDAAKRRCRQGIRGELADRVTIMSEDKLARPDANGHRKSLTFYQLALLWLERR